MVIKSVTVLLIATFLIPPGFVSADNSKGGEKSPVDEGQEAISISVENPPEKKEPTVHEADLPQTGTTPVDRPRDADRDQDKKEEAETKELGGASTDHNLLAQMTAGARTTENQLGTIDVDNVTGALLYQFPFFVSPGRSGVQPSLNIRYNNQARENHSMVGLGWSLDIPFIQRENKVGGEKLYTEYYFSSSLDGEIVLVSTSTDASLFRPKVEGGNFFSYVFSDNTWTIVDKKGTVYIFGHASSTQIFNPENPSKIFKWLLQEIRDTNGNYVRYEYNKHGNQAYPKSIIYTGHNTTDGIFEVTFSTTTRQDNVRLFNAGFEVRNDFLISEITTEVNDVWVNKYTLSYATSSRGFTSMLSSVTESGRDESGNVVTLPSTIFTYQSVSAEWDEDPDIEFPAPAAFIYYANTDLDDMKNNGTQMVDINDDGLLDIIHSKGATTTAYVHTGTGWATSSFTLPIAIVDNYGKDQGVRFADVDGDGRIDAFRYRENLSDALFRNTGSGWVPVSLPQALLPAHKFATPQGKDTGVRFFDINGDGRADFVYSRNNSDPVVYLYNGFIWDYAPEWDVPVAFVTNNSSSFDFGVRPVDMNNDGLVDLAYCTGSNNNRYFRVQFNKGDGTWQEGGSYNSFPTHTPCFAEDWEDTGTRLIDLDDDGILDLSRKEENGAEESFVSLNGEHIQLTDLQIPRPVVQHSYGADNGTRLEDLNGDGLTDQVSHHLGGEIKFAIRKGKRGEILSAIKSSKGSTTTIDYKMSAWHRDENGALLNPSLFTNLNTVEKISVHDGFATTSEITYSYEGGDYYFNNFTDKHPAGFGLVTKTDVLGNVTKTYFHQGNESATSTGEYNDHSSKIGRPYRTEQYDDDDNLFSKTINTWDRYGTMVANNATSSFVKLAHTVEFTYDGDGDHREKAESYVYNNINGNLSQKISWGEVVGNNDGTFSDSGTDKLTSVMTYATSSTTSTSPILLPAREIVLNHASITVQDTKIYYDTLSFGQVEKGNATKQEMLVGGSLYIDTEKTYNTYGLVLQEKDPRNNTTTYNYDTFNLYSATTTNHLGHTQTSLYDYSVGKPKQIRDANGFVFQVVYDGLDRVTEEKQPDVMAPTTLVAKATYVYTDNTFPTHVTKTDYLNSATTTDSHSYFDGLGRTTQERRQAEDTNTYVVMDSVYDVRGLKQKESLPYFSTGSGRTNATTTNSLYSMFDYDAMGRIKTIANAVGTTSNVYDDWQLTVTDAEGSIKDLYKDARGNLVRVDEHNGTSTYTTLYEWNDIGNLTKITDAVGNVRNFTYDNLGRRTYASDLHTVTDAEFSSSTFAYDETGNVTTMIDGKGQTVEYTYDTLNRLISENFAGQSGVEIVYAYDTCTYGIGKLCFATTSSSVLSNNYDALGRIANELDTIASTTFQTYYEYDRRGNQTVVVNPGGARTEYFYNDGSLVEHIRYKPSGGASVAIVEDIDYGPHGHAVFERRANGIETTNTYNPNALYRLVHRYSESELGGISPVIQDITYGYDAVGNVISLTDDAPTNNGRSVLYTYDDLHRLTSASTTATNNNDGYKEKYTYDPLGNILTKGTGFTTYHYQGTTTGSYANPHAVTKIRTSPLTYDKNGNLLSSLGATSTYTYRNELAVHVKGATTTTYTYDHTGSRISYTFGTITTLYPHRHLNISPTATTTHIFAGDTLVATIENQGTTTTTHHHHTDHLGSASVSTTDDSITSEITDYYPYGAQRFNESYGSDFTEQRKFTGHEYDEETNLTYANARYYNQNMARWISVDPLFLDIGTDLQKYNKKLEQVLSNPQELNAYSYVMNNPLKYVDPNGEAAIFAALLGLFMPTTLHSPNVGEEEGTQTSRNMEAGIFAASMLMPGDVGGRGMKGVSKIASGVGDDVGGVIKTASEWSITAFDPAKQRDFWLRGVDNSKLQNIIKSMFKLSDDIIGGTPGAIHYTKQTDIPIGNSDHLQKGTDLLRGLENLLKNQIKDLNRIELKNIKNLVKKLNKALDN